MSDHPHHEADDPHAPADAHGPDLADAHGHDAHGADSFDPTVPESATVRPPLGALIWPLLILLIVLALILPSVANAFAPYAPVTSGTAAEPAGGAPPATAGVPAEPATPTVAATVTTAPAVVATATLAPAPAPAVPATATTVSPTETAVPPTAPPVAVVPPMGDMEQGALRSLEIAGRTFTVESAEIVPDWKFSDQPGVASWVNGTVINYIIGLPYSDDNATFFQSVKAQDVLRLTVATGDVLTFKVSDIGRVAKNNTAVLAQDHPGTTLLLVGEPGVDDRALITAQYVP